mmetsp:Transcript_7470/g.28074  ORF Transcript_7470/g.28074 Transcript_7470/m.28074 type:complete len:106 (-) Transcript_7470:329-646(-)
MQLLRQKHKTRVAICGTRNESSSAHRRDVALGVCDRYRPPDWRDKRLNGPCQACSGVGRCISGDMCMWPFAGDIERKIPIAPHADWPLVTLKLHRLTSLATKEHD